jgi:hypothetical protein
MGGIVVADDMNFLVRRSAPRNEPQELQPFLMAVLIHAATDDAAIGYILLVGVSCYGVMQ